MKTLYDFFQDYVTVKTLDGERGYQTGEFGLQDACAAVTFRSFPPVLYLQLKCYEYDTQRDAMVRVCIASLPDDWLGFDLTLKVNDRYEFPFEIDLGEFLDEAADRTDPWRYELYSVLVNSGDTYSEYGFALIKLDQQSRWFKLDDSWVTPATDREVLEENYGGEPPNGVVPQTQMNQGMLMTRSTSANILVYVCKAAIGELMAPLTEEDTPPCLGELVLG